MTVNTEVTDLKQLNASEQTCRADTVKTSRRRRIRVLGVGWDC